MSWVVKAQSIQLGVYSVIQCNYLSIIVRSNKKLDHIATPQPVINVEKGGFYNIYLAPTPTNYSYSRVLIGI